MNNLGERLYELRTKNGMSQGDLAEKLDVSRQTISKWENNMSIPELDKIISLSNLFGVSVDYIVKGEGETPPQISQTAYENIKEPEPVRMLTINPTEKYVAGLSIAIGFFNLITLLYSSFLSIRTLIAYENSGVVNSTLFIINYIVSLVVSVSISVALLSRRKNLLSAALIIQSICNIAVWFLPSSDNEEKVLLVMISSVIMTAALLLRAYSSIFSSRKNAKILFVVTTALLIIQSAVSCAANFYIYSLILDMTTINAVISVFNTNLHNLPSLFMNIGIAAVIYLRANPKPSYEVEESAYPGYNDMYVGMVRHILLSLFTFGIYNCIWTYKTTENLNCSGNEIQSGAKKLLLCIFVPFYRIYWYYNQSKRLEALMKAKDENAPEFAIVTLILAIFVPVAAASAFLQVKVNEYAKK